MDKMDILSPLFKTVIVIHRTDRKSFKLIAPMGLLLRIFSLLPSLLLDVYQVILFENLFKPRQRRLAVL
ncbi:hypothetical protein WKI23_09125, partial [Streptococcus pneumoniae]|uniref:hypothetical protein n=1 Tax=Streptococcus pseudopneumoniae TaxID=257758 RepID=UPI003127E7D1